MQVRFKSHMCVKSEINKIHILSVQSYPYSNQLKLFDKNVFCSIMLTKFRSFIFFYKFSKQFQIKVCFL